jgi:rhodanese-related sulfurtransferase
MFNLFSTRPNDNETSVEDVSRRLAAGEPLFVLDVREPEEFAEARIAGSTLIPLGQLAIRAGEIPRDRPVVAVCRSGNRSGVATEMLRRAGFADVRNMRGGMIAWARAGLPWESGS